MKKILSVFCCVAAALVMCSTSQADLVAAYTFDDMTGTAPSANATVGDFSFENFGTLSATGGVFEVSGSNLQESATLTENSFLQFSVTGTDLAADETLQFTDFSFDLSSVDTGAPTTAQIYVSSTSDFAAQSLIGTGSTTSDTALESFNLNSADGTSDFTSSALTIANGETAFFRLYVTDGFRSNAFSRFLELDNVNISAVVATAVPEPSSLTLFAFGSVGMLIRRRR